MDRLGKREKTYGPSVIDSNFTRICPRLIPEGKSMSLADTQKRSWNGRKVLNELLFQNHTKFPLC
jgi:hypothetical protein